MKIFFACMTAFAMTFAAADSSLVYAFDDRPAQVEAGEACGLFWDCDQNYDDNFGGYGGGPACYEGIACDFENHVIEVPPPSLPNDPLPQDHSGGGDPYAGTCHEELMCHEHESPSQNTEEPKPKEEKPSKKPQENTNCTYPSQSDIDKCRKQEEDAEEKCMEYNGYACDAMTDRWGKYAPGKYKKYTLPFNFACKIVQRPWCDYIIDYNCSDSSGECSTR